MEEQIKFFIEKDPTDSYAVSKGAFCLNKWKYIKFVVVRMLLTFQDIVNPLLIASFIGWIQDPTPDTYNTTVWAFLTALAIPLINIVTRTICENLQFEIL